MEKVSTQRAGLNCVLIIFTTTMTGVQLQEEFWVPESKIVFSPPLLFPRYRISQRDYNNFIKPAGHYQDGVNFNYNETGERSDSDEGRTRVLLNEREEHSKNKYDRINLFNNTTWHTELGKSQVEYHESDSGLDIYGHRLKEPYKVEDPNDNDSRKVGKYVSYSDTQTSGFEVNDPNVRTAHTFLAKHNNEHEDDLSRDEDRQLRRQKGDSTTKQSSDRDRNRVRQQIRTDKPDGSLQNINDFERNHFSDPDTRRGQVRGAYDFGTHHFSDVTRQSGFGTEDKQDSGRNRNNFTGWHSDSDGKGEEGGLFTEDNDTGGGGRRRPPGENEDAGNVQRSHDLIWSPSETITEDVKHDSINLETTFDSEGYYFGEINKNGSTAGNHRPGQDEFSVQRNRFGDISGSDHHVSEFNEERETDSNRNRFSDTSWPSDYASGGEKQHVSTYDAAGGGEPAESQHNGEVMPFHHGGHPLRTGTRVATGPPTAVTSYTLPNGTKVVRLRRIVLYRKPHSSTQEESPRTFADIAKSIVRKKVAKFLSLFTIVQFPNEPCQTGDGVNGTCYHHLQCRSLGGVAGGSCAQGYGVCCYFEKSCGEVTRQNCSYFVNPGFPSPITNMLACILTIEKAHSDVSQIRLDFFTFELLGPTNGTCVDDQFIVTGQNTNSIAPIICGINTGQHIYMDVGGTTGPIQLNMLTMGGNLPRSFRIKVTQIKKGSPLEAPQNCFQYHTGIKGSIESFNYQMLGGSNQAVRSGYMNNLNYAICIHKEPGYCSVTYTNTAPDGAAYPFELSNVDQDGQPLISPGQAGAEVYNCPDDYIVINGMRLCGERLNDASVQIDFTRNYPVIDISNGPFIIPVRTNSNTNGRGFRIDYQQNTCAS